jgi:hypothetical protein
MEDIFQLTERNIDGMPKRRIKPFAGGYQSQLLYVNVL